MGGGGLVPAVASKINGLDWSISKNWQADHIARK